MQTEDKAWIEYRGNFSEVHDESNYSSPLQYFPESKEAWWPFPISSIDLNLFFAFHATLDKRKDG